MQVTKILYFSTLLLLSTFTAAQDQSQRQGSIAQEPTTLEYEQPVILKARILMPYEIASGTVVQMLLLATDILPVAQVNTAVFDSFGNIVIPVGSRMVGKYYGKRGNRHEVKWDGLQIPETPGTLRIDPPLQATMPDGSAGVSDFEIGQRVATITAKPFIVPSSR